MMHSPRHIQAWSWVVLSASFSTILLLFSGCSSGESSSPPPSTSPNSPTSPSSVHTAQPGRFNEQVTAIIAAPDGTGDIYVAGLFTTYNDQPVRPVVRIRPDGSLNERFVLAATIAPSVSNNRVRSLAAVDDGSGDIYIGATELTDAFGSTLVGRIWKVNADGSVDSSFTPGEVIYTQADVFLRTNVNTIVPIGDGSGRAYVCGAFDRYNGVEVPPLVRVTPTGSLDPTFQSDGRLPTERERLRKSGFQDADHRTVWNTHSSSPR